MTELIQLTPEQLADMIYATVECGECHIDKVCPRHFEALMVVCGGSPDLGNDVLWAKTLIACFNPDNIAWVTGVFLALRDGDEALAAKLAAARRVPWGKDGEPGERSIEALAHHLWGDGVAHRTPSTTWEQLPHAAQRQWREAARRYLTIAARAEQIA